MGEKVSTSATTEMRVSQPVTTTGGKQLRVTYNVPKLDGLGYTVVPHPPTPRD